MSPAEPGSFNVKMGARAVVVVAVLSLAGVAAPTAAFADRGNGNRGPDNIVEVRNTTDNSLVARSRAVVTHSPGGKVANNNVATAWATCAGCRTAAAAVQVVIVEGPYDTLEPGNLAAAINDSCTTCETFAYARQFVFIVGRRVPIGGWAESRIEKINDAVADVIHSRDPFPTMESELDGLSQQLVDVVRGEIERSGGSRDERDRRQVGEQAAAS